MFGCEAKKDVSNVEPDLGVPTINIGGLRPILFIPLPTEKSTPHANTAPKGAPQATLVDPLVLMEMRKFKLNPIIRKVSV